MTAHDRLTAEWQPHPEQAWGLPTTMAEFLDVLAITPSLGDNDAERVAEFLRVSPAALFMPPGLRDDLRREFDV